MSRWFLFVPFYSPVLQVFWKGDDTYSLSNSTLWIHFFSEWTPLWHFIADISQLYRFWSKLWAMNKCVFILRKYYIAATYKCNYSAQKLKWKSASDPLFFTIVSFCIHFQPNMIQFACYHATRAHLCLTTRDRLISTIWVRLILSALHKNNEENVVVSYSSGANYN